MNQSKFNLNLDIELKGVEAFNKLEKDGIDYDRKIDFKGGEIPDSYCELCLDVIDGEYEWSKLEDHEETKLSYYREELRKDGSSEAICRKCLSKIYAEIRKKTNANQRWIEKRDKIREYMIKK